MKYARIERERRYLLAEPPSDLALDSPYTRIHDLYLPNTRLRLRRMEDEQGQVIALKLTQKFHPSEGVGLETIITNLYLNDAEFQVLSNLKGKPLTKRRYKYPYANRNFILDIFEDALEGLILCEIEFDENSVSQPLKLPRITCEVTNEPFFTGGNLVNLTFAEVQNHAFSTSV